MLLGIALAEQLAGWAGEGLVPPPDRLAVVLAGGGHVLNVDSRAVLLTPDR